MTGTDQMVRITAEAMRAIEDAAVNPFNQTGQKMIDGTWLVPLSNELMVRIRSVALPGETISDTIIRGLRAATGAKAN